MEWNERLQMIVDYVENHLQRKQEPIEQQEVSEIAGCSYDFFLKVFSYMNGISFSEYIRSRKLTLAGHDLKSTDKRVVDVSYQYGYDSPTSFTKAFQLFHGVTPKEARSGNTQLRIVPKMQISVKQQYSWRLEEKPAFRLIGKSLWCEEGDLPDGFSEVRIPEADWAIFDCRGAVPQAIQNGWRYLQEEWILRYPFQHAKCPELEWYSSGNSYDSDYLSQIWIPVVVDKNK